MSSLNEFKHFKWLRIVQATTIQLYNCTTKQLCNYTTIQLYNYKTKQLYNYTTIKLYNYTTKQLCNYTTKQLLNLLNPVAKLWKTCLDKEVVLSNTPGRSSALKYVVHA